MAGSDQPVVHVLPGSQVSDDLADGAARENSVIRVMGDKVRSPGLEVGQQINSE